jgi:hypothetical protein
MEIKRNILEKNNKKRNEDRKNGVWGKNSLGRN